MFSNEIQASDLLLHFQQMLKGAERAIDQRKLFVVVEVIHARILQMKLAANPKLGFWFRRSPASAGRYPARSTRCRSARSESGDARFHWPLQDRSTLFLRVFAIKGNIAAIGKTDRVVFVVIFGRITKIRFHKSLPQRSQRTRAARKKCFHKSLLCVLCG